MNGPQDETDPPDATGAGSSADHAPGRSTGGDAGSRTTARTEADGGASADAASPGDRYEAWQGAAAGYRPSHTLRLRVELGRQLRRRRTRITLALLVALPVLLWASFEIGTDESGPGRGSFVELATGSGLNFALFSLFASVGFLFVVVVALFFGDTVAGEAAWSSLRYLLAAPIPRARLLRQKALVSGLLSLAALVLLPGVALLVGLAAYGSGPLTTPAGETLPFATGLAALAMVIVFLLVFSLWIAGLSLLLSVSTDAPLGAVGGAVLVFIVSQILDQITALGDLRNFLPTHYAYAWTDLLSTQPDFTDPARGVFAAVAYATVFLLAAGFRFERKDITS
ncbi:ABC-2 type transport system permease protein [Actinoalloteichus hoggarensis]|uniref:ABC-2 family transporter protein n=1 Tax=Actinoalloteichus hoggarensis TaxID=1470176 RepID=A0A221W1L4_9PSEU|nr:ABC transporter permease [Actinoalloteichus hoggarensis]ASO19650.1 ABC-2 family transporter protein [Actinoalloteichus hoggarensis]MBB5919643.1 ABC-2 type transport system permease protein [Actinoalloteichus hoggarensis]